MTPTPPARRSADPPLSAPKQSKMLREPARWHETKQRSPHHAAASCGYDSLSYRARGGRPAALGAQLRLGIGYIELVGDTQLAKHARR